MKISTEIYDAALLVGERWAIEMVAKAGFDAWDFSMFDMCGYDWERRCALPSKHPLAGADYLRFARELKQVGLDNGIHCNQSHAPFPSGCREIRDCFRRAIECTAEAGGSICVIHPDNNSCAEKNAEMYQELLPFAKACGVKIAAENMFNWNDERNESVFAACATSEDFLAHLHAVNDPYLVACLDIGHAELRSSGSGAVNMIHALGHHLQALHLHDNDLVHDAHLIPMTMNIDFPPIIRALKEIGYQGYFTLEASNAMEGYSARQLPQRLAEKAASARKLVEMFEA